MSLVWWPSTGAHTQPSGIVKIYQIQSHPGAAGRKRQCGNISRRRRRRRAGHCWQTLWLFCWQFKCSLLRKMEPYVGIVYRNEMKYRLAFDVALPVINCFSEKWSYQRRAWKWLILIANNLDGKEILRNCIMTSKRWVSTRLTPDTSTLFCWKRPFKRLKSKHAP